MKTLMSLGLLLGVTWLAMHSQQPPPPKQGNQNAQEVGHNPKEPVTIKTGEKAPLEVSTVKDWWDKILVVATVLLVAVGAFGIKYAIKTLTEVKKQASLMDGQLKEMQEQARVMDRQAALMEGQLKEMQEAGKQTDKNIVLAQQHADSAKVAAEAALKNSSAIIAIERAWIVAEMQPPPVYLPYHIMPITCLLRNVGKTPARVKRVAERPWVANERTPLPGRPQYSASEIYGDAQGKGAIMAPDAAMLRVVYIQPGDMERVESGEATLFVHGYVLYEDIFEREHATNYCFYLNVPMEGADSATRTFFVSDLPGYNDAT